MAARLAWQRRVWATAADTDRAVVYAGAGAAVRSAAALATDTACTASRADGRLGDAGPYSLRPGPDSAQRRRAPQAVAGRLLLEPRDFSALGRDGLDQQQLHRAPGPRYVRHRLGWPVCCDRRRYGRRHMGGCGSFKTPDAGESEPQS